MGNSSGSSSSNAGSGDNRRHVCILYNGSDTTQKKNAKLFRDALRGGDGGKNFTVQLTDVNHQDFDGVKWLKKIENVLVLCVDENGAQSLQRIIDEREIQDMDAMPKVLSVSFGTTRPRSIMGEILERHGHLDQKDFCFGFQNVSNLTTHDFNESDVMRKLKTSIMSAKIE